MAFIKWLKFKLGFNSDLKCRNYTCENCQFLEGCIKDGVVK